MTKKTIGPNPTPPVLRTVQTKSGQSSGLSKSSSKDAAIELGLRDGQSLELLKALHILTRDGRLNADSRRKLKQVYHLTQFLEGAMHDIVGQNHLDPVRAGGVQLTLADHGAGKSYLGFILYDLLVNTGPLQSEAGAAQPIVHVYGIETRAELVASSQALAKRLGFERNMTFLNMSVSESRHEGVLPAAIDVVTALHACDAATDDAIAFGLQKQAAFMALVPCCQAEVAAQLRGSKALALSRTPLAEIWRHPLHTREFGSHITNVMRCLYLESQGYSVTVTELVGWEHSMKNELILAKRTGQKKVSAGERLRALVDEFGLHEMACNRYAALFEKI